MATASVRLDAAAIRHLATGRDGPIVRELLVRGRRVESIAKQLCGVDTGRLRASIHTEVAVIGDDPVVYVGTAVDYARFHHDGTGIFGPRGRPIRPVRGKFLVWVDRRTGKRVFAREVRGARGTHFLLSALESARR